MKTKIKCEWTFLDENGDYVPEDADYQIYVVTIGDTPVYYKRWPQQEVFETDVEKFRENATLAEFAKKLQSVLEGWRV